MKYLMAFLLVALVAACADSDGSMVVDPGAPVSVDFIPPTIDPQTGTGQNIGVVVKSRENEYWYASEDVNNIAPLGSYCDKLPYGATVWVKNCIVKAAFSRRYCGC